MIIDTHVLLWFGFEGHKLSKAAKNALKKERKLLSVGSVMEVAIKVGNGRLELSVSTEQFFRRIIQDIGLTLLPIHFDDALAIEALPLHHRDPFDRLLIAQALRRNVPIVSHDETFDLYGVKRVW